MAPGVLDLDASIEVAKGLFGGEIAGADRNFAVAARNVEHVGWLAESR